MKPQGLLHARGCRGAGRVGSLFVLALLVGCRGGQGEVSGQVLYRGKPVTGGWVTFRPADGSKNTVPAQIDENGNYRATLPTGEVKIAVDNRELQRQPSDRAAVPVAPPGVKLPPAPKGAAEARQSAVAPDTLPGVYVPIPPQAYDADTSGLSYVVKPGAQSHDIELK